MITWLFAGPSLWPEAPSLPANVNLVPPVAAGDVYDAVIAGATCIAIIDGFFGDRASVRHKELLWALASGARVLGAASVGALRAAELRSFGMVPVGRIAEEYATGRRSRDADVAVAHAPAELRWKPLTVALVDMEARIRRAVCSSDVAEASIQGWLDVVRGIYFTRRTTEAALSALASLPAPQRPPASVLSWVASDTHSAKRDDALELLATLDQPMPTASVAEVPEDMFHRRELDRCRRRHERSKAQACQL